MPEASDDNLTQLNRTRAAIVLSDAAIYALNSDWDDVTKKAADEIMTRAYDSLGAAAHKARVQEIQRAGQLLAAAESVLDGQLASEIHKFLETFGR